ncbi:helicase associated domain-containing protein [Mycolicibacterium wolinskyi]|uniref:Helicase n=1 Tax=Mycolicibacterium wolinskyi TaxID=59750 RepID=A0A1X2FIZ8_9MYCO|nr:MULTISPECIES: helicase associated domain-containing protein [Mycolicibacterium]MCV7288177.1 helicase associated domain-containing protein [Mycolicibacterium wolinskyi]MCV7296902.1 helicase associated domain-containing protein [Mycolicibacterium goodii]ORX18415.1 helicase [Mycolicibacterium wolinskyi]
MSSAQTPSGTAEWTKSLRALQSYRELRGNAEVGQRVRAFGVDLGKWVAQCRDAYWNGELDADRVKALQRIEGWHWGFSRHGSWRHGFDILQAYARSHRTTHVFDTTVIDGLDLQAWTAAQRSAYLNGQLTKTQIELLGTLRDWTWDQDEIRWRHGILAAHRFIERHGSLDDVDRDTRIDDYPLGQWLQRCREDFRADALPAERVTALEELAGFSWGRQHDQWTHGYEALTHYAADNRHAAPSQHTVIDGFRLGWWVTRKRHQYRQGSLTDEQITALEALPGWQWSPLDDQWQRGLNTLRRYTEQHGHANPPRGYTVDGYPVGDWARAQRDSYDRSRMPRQRVTQLEALPGWTWNA